jgi:hypothetical protein
MVKRLSNTRLPFGNRRHFLAASLLGLLSGCKSTQHAEVRDPEKADMVGSHQAGTETFKPLVDQTLQQLLTRHCQQPVILPTGAMMPPEPKRICFVAVENKSAEEIGDFKDQLYQIIDLHITNSGVFQPVNKRFVDAGLALTRLRPDALFIPQNMRAFVAAMEQQGQPFDFLLYATITSGTTRENKEYQRDYLLTLELINVVDGTQDKQAATISKGYYHSAGAKWLSNLGLKR